MNRFTSGVVFLLVLDPLFAACRTPVDAAVSPATANAAQGDNLPPVRKKGTIFKDDVDRAIALIAARTAKDGTAAPYSTSLREAAQILCAMGHCHRFYVALDNPRIRATLDVLIGGRRNDGSFGKDAASAAATTAWVADALSALDAERYGDEIAAAGAWQERQGTAAPAWQQLVSGVLAEVRQDVFPEQLGAEQAQFVRTAAAAPQSFDVAAATPVLLRLVACQAANRLLDGAQDPAAATFTAVQTKAFDFLMQQQKDGVWMAKYEGKSFPDPAITGFALMALQTKPKGKRTAAEAATIEQGLRWLLGKQNEDGSFGQQVQNYTTSVVAGALARWGDAAAKPALEKAQKYILKCQNAEGTGYQSSDRDYGSIGYGGSQRGDLSNVNFALQALRESGLPADHEAFQKALVFLQRSQNLKSVNDFSGKVSNPDDEGKLIDVVPADNGGAAYYPGNSAAGYDVTPDGKSQPRSYGSMTYALLKSYTLCGVKADDPRVQAAVKWIGANWTLAENPGFAPTLGEKAKYAGLFYYYMVLAQALDMSGQTTIPTAGKDGKPLAVDWRAALRQHLESLQQKNGSWINEKNARWMEGLDVLCTCYAMVALERCN